MAASGQTINDRLNAVRYALVGQGLARTVCKATTLEVLGPKKKHIDYLLACTNEPNVSTPQLANLLIERTQHTNWAVVFKSLISIHHLMSYGNERFTQYLATSNHSFELAEFMDRTTPQGYNMSAFVRRYAKYINDKSISYRTLAIDLCKIRSGNDNALRTMNMDNLSKTLPIVQAQFDSLLEFGAEPKDLTNNGVIMAAFRLLYKDLVRLYVAYQEAIINLLERYFKLSRKKTREALELYKKYLARMDKVAGFLHTVDAVGLDKSEMPDLTNSPASILKLLEQHLAQLEAKKRGATPADEDEATDAGGDVAKENEPPAAKAEAANEADKTKQTAKNEPQQSKQATKQAAQTSEPQAERKPPVCAAEPEKPAPPQKPARPSPKASPKVSPGSSKPAPKVAAAMDSSSAAPAASSPAPPPPPAPAASDKKGPPERPAKPPSRPPPPSASSAAAAQAPVAPSSSSSTPTTCPPEPVAGRDESASAPSSQVKPVSSPVPPPPHPPPPHSSQHAASATEPQPTEVEQSTATTESNQEALKESNNETNGRAESDDENGDTAPTCSAAAAAGNEAVEIGGTNHNDAGEMNEQETNHVNNGTGSEAAVEEQVVEDEEMIPPPPPPIDENELEDNNIAQEPAAGTGSPEPVVNGQ